MSQAVPLLNSALIPKLLSRIRQAFGAISDHRDPKKCEISLVDALMSGLAVFLLKFPSLLKFDEQREEPHIRHNLQSLFGIQQAPCDTQMRKIIDPVEPAQLHAAYRAMFQTLKASDVFKSFRFLNDYYLLAVDGTGYFSSSSIHCSDCASKKTRSGETLYYHQLMAGAFVSPGKKTVLPVIPEPIHRHDGDAKNDCEQAAVKRFLIRLRQDFTELPIILVEDSLFSNGPHIKLLKELNLSFIIGVKEGDHAHLFQAVAEQEQQGHVHRVIRRDDPGLVERTYRFINNVTLNKTHPLKVNFIEYTEKKNGALVYRFSWVTDIRIAEYNCSDLVRGGRARWKVENETFNTLKNQGYHLERNFGHGKQHLSTNFALLTVLAFLIDQIQELGCRFFQNARQRFRSRTSLWARMRALFVGYIIDHWETYWQSIADGHQATRLSPKVAAEYNNTS